MKYAIKSKMGYWNTQGWTPNKKDAQKLPSLAESYEKSLKMRKDNIQAITIEIK